MIEDSIEGDEMEMDGEEEEGEGLQDDRHLIGRRNQIIAANSNMIMNNQMEWTNRLNSRVLSNVRQAFDLTDSDFDENDLIFHPGAGVGPGGGPDLLMVSPEEAAMLAGGVGSLHQDGGGMMIRN